LPCAKPGTLYIKLDGKERRKNTCSNSEVVNYGFRNQYRADSDPNTPQVKASVIEIL
jgi:hypothetical protein